MANHSQDGCHSFGTGQVGGSADHIPLTCFAGVRISQRNMSSYSDSYFSLENPLYATDGSRHSGCVCPLSTRRCLTHFRSLNGKGKSKKRVESIDISPGKEYAMEISLPASGSGMS